MGHDPESVGVVFSLEDSVWYSLPPVGLVSDGIDCGRSGCSLCALSGRCCDSNEQHREQGVAFAWDDETNADTDADDLFSVAAGKTKDGSRPSL